MGVSLRSQSTQAPDTASRCSLEIPFQAYTDLPETEDDMSISNSRVDSIPHGDRVGPHLSSAWHRTLAIFFPSFGLRRKNEDEDKYDALPLLSESPPQTRRRIGRPRWSRWLLRGLIGFFVMLYVQTQSQLLILEYLEADFCTLEESYNSSL